METAGTRAPTWKPLILSAAAILLGGIVVYSASSILGLESDPPNGSRVVNPIRFGVEGGVTLLVSVLFLLLVLRNKERRVLRSLGFRPTNLSWKDYALVLIGGEFVSAIGVSLAIASGWLFKSEPSWEIPYSQMSANVGTTFVLLVALCPGFGEEILFRGYLQAAWLRRFKPWTAIILTSVLFGLTHGSVPRFLSMTAGGIWLGVLAWRTGSIWPSVWSHAFSNGVWSLYMILSSSGPASESDELKWGVVIGVTGVSFVAFLLALRVLKRQQPIEAMVVRPEESAPAV